MVVDVVICRWVLVVAGEDTGTWGFRRAVQNIAALVYVYDRILASPRPSRL